MNEENNKESPTETESSNGNGNESFTKAQEAFSKFANELGIKLFSLNPREFSVYLVANVPYASHMKGGPRVEISINALLSQEDLRFHLLESLGKVSLLKRGVSIEVKSKLDEGERFVQLVNPINRLIKAGKLMPREEVTVEYVYTARVKHKASGIVVVKECAAGAKSWTDLIYEAQIELATKATIVGYEKLGGFKNLKGNKVKPQRKLGVD